MPLFQLMNSPIRDDLQGVLTNLYRMCFIRTLQPVATSLRIVRFRSNIIERISDLLALNSSDTPYLTSRDFRHLTDILQISFISCHD